jgi:hypothetical protein
MAYIVSELIFGQVALMRVRLYSMEEIAAGGENVLCNELLFSLQPNDFKYIYTVILDIQVLKICM